MKQTQLVIRKGSTFTAQLRWEKDVLIYKPITAVPQLAPVHLGVTGHGMKTGWRFAVESVKGMKELNTAKPTDVDTWYSATEVDPDIVEINNVNASDFAAYVSGGVIKYYAPEPLAGFDARMDIKDKVGGEVLVSLTASNGYLTVNESENYIEVKIPDEVTAAVLKKKGVYDLEMVAETGEVYLVAAGPVVFEGEVTT